jgi:hypothetical protein
MGLGDEIGNAFVGDPNSPFQAVFGPSGGGFDFFMDILPGVVNSNGGHVDFDLGNMATQGLAGLHSHHELFMGYHSPMKQYATSFVLRFSTSNHDGILRDYALSYQLRPHNNPVQGTYGGCVDWQTDEALPSNPTDHYTDRYLTLNAECDFPANQAGQGTLHTPPIDGGWTNADINWAALAQWAHDANIWGELDVNTVQGNLHLQFYETLYGPKNTALGEVDVLQRNWQMFYQ